MARKIFSSLVGLDLGAIASVVCARYRLRVVLFLATFHLLLAFLGAPASANPIAVSPQDTNTTRNSPPVSLFDFDGSALGTIPIPDFDPVQDLAFDPDTGDLYALRVDPNTSTSILSNLTTSTDAVAQGLILFMDQSADISIHDGVIAVSPRDTNSIRNSPPVSLFDFDGNLVGTIAIPDFDPVQDLAFDPDTGDLYALRVDPNTSTSILSNLTTSTDVIAAGLSLFMDRDADIAIYDGVIAVSPQDTNFTSGSPPVSLFDFDGNLVGTIPIPDFIPVQDLAFDLATGDLYALRATPNGDLGILSNLDTTTDVMTEGLNLSIDRSADLASVRS